MYSDGIFFSNSNKSNRLIHTLNTPFMHKLFIGAVALLANNLAIFAQNKLDFVADVVQYRGNGQTTNVEFNYSFPDTALKYVADKVGYIGEAYCRLTIIQSGADTIVDEWIASANSAVQRVQHQRFYSGVRKCKVRPGKAFFLLNVRDVHDSMRTTASSFAYEIRAFGLNVDVSDVMFTQPLSMNADPRFERNGVDAVPNPRHECIGVDPVIPVYLEIYNAKLNGLDTFVIEYQVLDNVQREMFTMYRKMLANADGLVARDDLPVGVTVSGVYKLKVSIKSKDLDKTFASVMDKFYILNPELPPQGSFYLTEEEKFMTSEWAVTKGDKLNLEMELSKVLSSAAERTTADAMSDDRSKQRYLYRFWKNRDPDPSTSENERLEDFRKMYQRAQTFYTSAITKDGWRTDRGNVLLKYGIPNQIEQFIQTIDAKPYETWFYSNIQGGVYFYFVDWQLLQNHKLVHSTRLGEIRNENWFNQWAKAFSPDPNPTESIQQNPR